MGNAFAWFTCGAAVASVIWFYLARFESRSVHKDFMDLADEFESHLDKCTKCKRSRRCRKG